MSKPGSSAPRDEDPLHELARRLREGAGSEMREEAAVTELETHIGRLRGRSLADLATEAMHRGDRLSVIAHGRTLTGRPRFVGKDYLVLETQTHVADVRLDRVVITVVRSPTGGHSTKGGSATLRARLAEYEQTGEAVVILATDAAHEVTGTILVAAADHVVMEDRDGGQVVIPTRSVSIVLRPRPGTR